MEAMERIKSKEQTILLMKKTWWLKPLTNDTPHNFAEVMSKQSKKRLQALTRTKVVLQNSKSVV